MSGFADVPNASCGDCGHGFCDPATASCVCMRMFYGSQCDTSYLGAIRPYIWYIFITIVISAHTLFIAAVARSVGVRVIRASALRKISLWRALNQRDIAGLIGGTGCLLRIIWFLFITTAVEISPTPYIVTDGTLLRLPQIAWLIGYLIVILIWNDVVKAAMNDRVGRRVKIIVGVSIITIASVVVPASIVESSAGATDSIVAKLMSDGILAMYILVLDCFGVVYAWKLMRILKMFQGISADSRHEHKLQDIIRNTLHTLMCAVAAGVTLIIALITLFSLRLSPEKSPYGYFGYQITVHIFVECVGAGALVYSTYQAPKQRRARSVASPMASSMQAPLL